MISVSHVSKKFGTTTVVNDVSFTVNEGETLVLLGSSGCGKTTTLKMINRLIDFDAGKIEIDGEDILIQDVVSLRRRIGYVFQGIGLFPHMTILENVAIVLRIEKQSEQNRKQRAEELLVLVNLDPEKFGLRFPHELSGGQCQRVGVARALASEPKYLLMDEPFGALDAINRDAMQEEVAALRDRLQKTVVFVTHDIFEAVRMGDRIAVMNQGRIEQLGTTSELVHQPKTQFVKDLMQKAKDQLKIFMEV